MTRPIVVGVALREDDAAPLALAHVIGRVTGGPLALVHAYPYEPLTVPAPEYEAALREQAEAGLAELAAGLEVPTTRHAIARVSPARALHEAAERLGAAALVVGSTHRAGMRHVLPGGVGERVLAGAPCPVIVAPRDYAEPDGAAPRIGVAFDDSAEARLALDTAIALARALDATVTTLTVSEPIEQAPAAMVPGWTIPPGYNEARREHAERVLAAARERVPAELLGDTRLLIGHPGEQLAQASADVDVLVCGSRGYGPLRAVLLGGVSTALAHTARCPLLVIPRGELPALAQLEPVARSASA